MDTAKSETAPETVNKPLGQDKLMAELIIQDPRSLYGFMLMDMITSDLIASNEYIDPSLPENRDKFALLRDADEKLLTPLNQMKSSIENMENGHNLWSKLSADFNRRNTLAFSQRGQKYVVSTGTYKGEDFEKGYEDFMQSDPPITLATDFETLKKKVSQFVSTW